MEKSDPSQSCPSVSCPEDVRWQAITADLFQSTQTCQHQLTRKDAPNRVVWNQLSHDAFTNSLCTSPVFRSPDFNRPFILQMDASDRGVGAVLSQQDNNGADHPIAYFSKKLLP